MKAGDKVSMFGGRFTGTVVKDPKPDAELVLVRWISAKVHYRALIARQDLEPIAATVPEPESPP